MWKYFLALVIAAVALADDPHPTLALGSPAPDFALTGTDGSIHRLADYASSKVLVVIFTCNHCPIAQLYEDRIQQMATDYRGKGAAVVAIQPNDPSAIRIDELDSSDMSDSFNEMKARMAYRHLNYPYLYDGETQSVSEAYGPKATPHAFIFDSERKLRYEGRVDNSYRKELVDSNDARNAIDALLKGQPVPLAHTGVFGCSTKWKSKQASRISALKKIEAEPVNLQPASLTDLKALRANNTDKLLLINFWMRMCDPCLRQIPAIQDIFRMYRMQQIEVISISMDLPDEATEVLDVLRVQHASTRNLLLAPDGVKAMLDGAFDPEWQTFVPLPLTVLIAPGGKVIFEKAGEIDMLRLRRLILANLPGVYAGFRDYWGTP
jgi:peroxiredoxin